MTSAPAASPPQRFALPLWAWVAMAWLANAVFRATQYWGPADQDRGVMLRLAQETASAAIWIGITLFLVFLAEHLHRRQASRLRWILVHCVVVTAVVLGRALFVWATDPVLGWYPSPPSVRLLLMTSAAYNSVTTWLLVGVAQAIVQSRRVRSDARRITELEAKLALARLEALRARLDPHFLFNALNSVAEMVHRDPDVADRMLVSLAELLRVSLRPDMPQQRPLRDEIALVEHYLQIEKIRLGERLQVGWAIDPPCLAVPVPTLILQPLVENAIVHAIARRREPGRLDLRARLAADELRIEIENTAGPDGPAAPGSGTGLGATRERLQVLHGERARLRQVQQDGLYRVELALPLPDGFSAATALRTRETAA